MINGVETTASPRATVTTVGTAARATVERGGTEVGNPGGGADGGEHRRPA